jgi:hypothetical protein
MKDFLTFDFFIAEDALVVFYLTCALLIPLVSWYFLLWVVRRYAVVMKLYTSGRSSLLVSLLIFIMRKIRFFREKVDRKITWQSLTAAQRLKFLVVFLMIVFFAELFLRLMFEYLIAFMQMHEWLKPHAVT